MKLKKYVPMFVMLVLLTPAFVTPGYGSETVEYSLDKAHSSVSFIVRHMVVSKVRGQFNDFDVTITEKDGDITHGSVSAVIKAASIDTANEKRDNHLRSADFFDAEKFPELKFKTVKIKKKGDAYEAWGELTMHGVTKKIVLPFEILGKMKDKRGNTRLGIEAHMKLDRKEYGLTWNRTLDQGGVAVGNEVKIEIFLEMISKGAK